MPSMGSHADRERRLASRPGGVAEAMSRRTHTGPMRRARLALVGLLAAVSLLGGCVSVIGSGGTPAGIGMAAPSAGATAAVPPTATPTPTPEAVPAPEPEPVLLPIFVYHHVKPSPDNFIAISPATFESQLQLIDSLGYTPITAQELHAHIREGAALPPKPVMITFDDGWGNQIDHAVPLLDKYGYHATFFVYPKAIKGGAFMSSAEVQSLVAGGHDVQSHTWAHTPVTGKAGETADDLVARFSNDFKTTGDWLAKTTGSAPLAFAYPFGYYDILSTSVLSANGIGIAFTVDEAPNTLAEEDPLLFKRFSVFKAGTLETFKQQLTGGVLTVTDASPAAGTLVPGSSATISGTISEPVDATSVEVLWDTKPVKASIEETAGVIRFSTTQSGKAGFHYVGLRARDSVGRVYYQSWGFSLR